MVVDFDIMAAEPGAPVLIKIDNGAGIIDITQRFVPDNRIMRDNRSIRRRVQSNEKILEAIAFADGLDLSGILKKYRRRQYG